MSIQIRPAQPHDADFLAWAILTAARSHRDKGWFDIILNAPEDACLEYLRRLTLTTTRSWWHYSRFHIARVGEQVAATLCAFRAGDGYPLSQPAMVEVAQSLGVSEQEQAAMWHRGTYLFTCVMESSDDLWTIENVATLPAHRRRGLAGVLLERAFEEGRQQGFGEAQITFLIDNDAAERAYVKAGFTFAGEKRHQDFAAAVGAPGLRRFVRRL
jgi:ribosomal protein S18 acetylase RimI-like enzyme